MSTDSDIFFHKNTVTWLVPKIKRGRLHVRQVIKAPALEKLGLSNNQAALLGVVSGNDYSENIKGFGISSNLKIIKKVFYF